MTVEELIEATKRKSVTLEDIAEYKARVKERERKFDNESRKLAVNNEFMARSYNL